MSECSCVACLECGGSGTVWFDVGGEYLGNHAHMNGVAVHRFDKQKRRRPDGHARQAMLTPAYFLEPVRALLGGIDLDPCTEQDNPTAATAFYCLPDDGCTLPWTGPRI